MESNTTVSYEFISELKKTLRVKSNNADSEIEDLVKTAVHDMELRGVRTKGESDPLTCQAIKLYCKGHYGYDEDAEKYQDAYESLRDSMALSKKYKMNGEEEPNG